MGAVGAPRQSAVPVRLGQLRGAPFVQIYEITAIYRRAPRKPLRIANRPKLRCTWAMPTVITPVFVVSCLVWALAAPVFAAPTPPGPLRVAVMPFGNTSPTRELDALGSGLQSMIATDLAQAQAFTLVERQRLADIAGELKLGRGGMVDKATAVKVGKLAGATHLLAGTFAVLGDKMRIDGRMFAVADGTVLLGESIAGDKDAFFELEKQLVQKIVATAGVAVAAKERAAIGKVHTTDFEAFHQYSQGLALFDEKKYQQAVEALRAAATKDQDFKLAAVTLAEYQQIIAKLQSRADEIQSSQTELDNLARHKLAGQEAAVIQKLFSIVGDKADKDPIPRLTALYLLATVYGNISNGGSDLSKIQELEDRFALQRLADPLVQAYWAGAAPLFPKMPAVIRDQFNIALSKTIDDFTKDFAENMAELQRNDPSGCAYTTERPLQLLCNLTWWGSRDDTVRQLARRLRLDVVQEADLYAKLQQLAIQAKVPVANRLPMLRQLALDYRHAAEIGKSSALFTQLAGALTDPADIRAVAAELELNRRAATILAKSPHAAVVREYLQASALGQAAFDSVLGQAEERLNEPVLAPWALLELNRQRKWPASGRFGGGNGDLAMLVGGHPAWLLQQNWYALVSGPRNNGFATPSLRYYLADPADAIDNVVVLEGAPRADLHLKFDVQYPTAADFWPPQKEPYSHTKNLAELGLDVAGKTRPEVGVLFGVADVDVDPQTDPKTTKSVVVRPMRGYLLALQANKLQLVLLTETGRGGNGLSGVTKEVKQFARKVLAEQPADVAAPVLHVALDVAGKTATLTVNGQAHRFEVAADHTGFGGLLWRGAGHAQVTLLP